MSRVKRSLFIFRRDIRVIDNTALNAALASSDEVLACFIFNDKQIGDHRYRSNNGLAFLIESLEEVAAALSERGGKLFVFHGEVITTVESILAERGIEAVYVNKDYTPFSRERDKAIFELCSGRGIAFHSLSDALLVEPSTFGKSDGTPYTVYTPFFKRAALEEIRHPTTVKKGSFYAGKCRLAEILPRTLWPSTTAPRRRSNGGRNAGLSILSTIKRHAAYAEERDFPVMDATTILSPHNKFGTVSIREVYWRVADELGHGHTIIRELFWRDFFTHIAWHFPHVFAGAFHKYYNKIEWDNNRSLFERWCAGTTGFPIVDAGMRELVATGFMHNRVRMIVASFLVKDLHIDWRWGEAFFAHHLTEYDPAVNNGSWQWAASTGCDSQPYFRIFNPWLQQNRFDQGCEYIKRWIPELCNLTPRQIHALGETKPGKRPDSGSYPQPIVNHSEQKTRAEMMFKDVR